MLSAFDGERRTMSTKNEDKPKASVERFEDPPVARALFGHVDFAWIWLILRVYAGYEWASAGWEKLHSAAWTGSQAGAAMTGFVNGALQEASGAHPAVQNWYASFLHTVVLPHVVAWSWLITLAEFLVGIALIAGIFTGIAAFFGGMMNMNYLLAGAVSTNPILLLIAFFLVLAWKTAGWWGLDRWILPALGTPWRPGAIFRSHEAGGGGGGAAKKMVERAGEA
jgi:thiosulfate dehydrogenase [quinone] large subunit